MKKLLIVTMLMSIGYSEYPEDDTDNVFEIVGLFNCIFRIV